MTDWKPLSVREAGDSAAYDGPFDGVPDWLFPDLWDWFKDRYPMWVTTMGGSYDRLEVRDDFRRIGMALGLTFENIGAYTPPDEMQSRLRGICIADRSVFLDVIDYWLAHDSKGQKTEKVALDALLGRGRSAWRVHMADPSALVRRVSPVAQAAADALMPEGRAGEHLARAWVATYGRTGNPSEGYRESIKAVEAAAKPVVSPANDRATLGTIIADIRNDPTKWTLDLHSPTRADQMPQVQGMLELLWKGQSDRHGTPDPDASLSVTQEQAEAALHLALTLVQWFTSGVVTRV